METSKVIHVVSCHAAGEVGDVMVDAQALGFAIRPGKIDRSPTGSALDCHIDSTVSVGGHPGIVPVVCGSAWITGTYQHTLDPSDPYPQGYRLSDTWPASDLDITALG